MNLDQIDIPAPTARPLAEVSSEPKYRLMAVNTLEHTLRVTVQKYPATLGGLVSAGDDGRRLSRCLTQRRKLKTVGHWDPEVVQFYIAIGSSRDEWIEVNPPPEWPQVLANALRWKDPPSSAASQVAEPCGTWRCLLHTGDLAHSGDKRRSDALRNAFCAIEYAVARASLETRLAATAGALERVLPTWHFYDAFYEFLFHAYGEGRGEAADNELIRAWKNPEELTKFVRLFRRVVHDICEQVDDVVKKVEQVLPASSRTPVAADLLLFIAEVQTARLSSIRVPTDLF